LSAVQSFHRNHACFFCICVATHKKPCVLLWLELGCDHVSCGRLSTLRSPLPKKTPCPFSWRQKQHQHQHHNSCHRHHHCRLLNRSCHHLNRCCHHLLSTLLKHEEDVSSAQACCLFGRTCELLLLVCSNCWRQSSCSCRHLHRCSRHRSRCCRHHLPPPTLLKQREDISLGWTFGRRTCNCCCQAQCERLLVC